MMTRVTIMLVSLRRSSFAMNKRRRSQEATWVMADWPAGTLGAPSTNGRGLGAWAAALACGVLMLAACGGAPDRLSAQATTSSRPPTAAESCARQVRYWVTEALKPDTTTYGDYQTMGLTGTYYELVLDISKEAKRLRKTATQEQTLAFVAEEAKRRCAKAATTCTTTTGSYNGFPSC
jgi:hypothetical protein